MPTIDLNNASLGLPAGLMAGVISGILARIAMRLVTLVVGLRPSFSVEGTVITLIIGATLGIAFWVLFVGVRRWVPLPDLGKGLLVGVVLLLIFVVPPFLSPEGEFALLLPLTGLIIFGPIPVVYGLMLVRVLGRLERGRGWVDSQRRVGLGWGILFGLA